MADCSGFIAPLNLQCLLVNNFAGSMEIFTFIAFMFIAGIGAYFRMVNWVVLVMLALFAIIMAQFFQGIYFLAILIAGLVVGYILSKIVKS